MSGLPLALTVETMQVSYEVDVLSDLDSYDPSYRNFATALKAVRIRFFQGSAGFASHDQIVAKAAAVR
jgi:hypothetical protein